jgi:hypothetical protein
MRIASVVHGPDRKEARKAFAEQHRADMPMKRNADRNAERTDQKRCNTAEFSGYPATFAAAREAPGGKMQPNEKEGPDQDGLPPGQSCR